MRGFDRQRLLALAVAGRLEVVSSCFERDRGKRVLLFQVFPPDVTESVCPIFPWDFTSDGGYASEDERGVVTLYVDAGRYFEFWVLPAPNEQAASTRRRAAEVGESAKERALDAVAAHADPQWLAAARAAVDWASRQWHAFSSDDVWERLDAEQVPAPAEARALGAVMQQCAREKLIMATGEWTKSRRAENHRRPVRVWRRR